MKGGREGEREMVGEEGGGRGRVGGREGSGGRGGIKMCILTLQFIYQTPDNLLLRKGEKRKVCQAKNELERVQNYFQAHNVYE